MRALMTRGLLLLTAAGLLLAANARRDAKRMADEYDWTAVERKAFTQTVNCAGIAEAANVAPVRSEVDEAILQRLVREGDRVKAGQPLLVLSQTGTQLDYNRRKNAHQFAGDELKKARKELAVQKKLFRSQAVAYKNVEDAQRYLKKARADFEIAAQELKLAEEKLQKTTVFSPISGVLLKDFLTGRTRVSSGQDLFQIGDVTSFIVRARVDELDIQKVREGQEAIIEVDAIADKSIRGKVKTIAAQADRKAFADVEVVIELPDSKELPLKHNLSVRAGIVLDEIPDTLALPLAAVKREESGESIVVRDARGRIRWRKVKLGRVSAKEAEVLEGLTPGEEIGVRKRST